MVYALYFVIFSLLSGCHSPGPDVVERSYRHNYGPEMNPEEWEANGHTGEVVEMRRDGVEVRQRYNRGVLHEECSTTFPHSRMAEYVKEYENGTLVSVTHNSLAGYPYTQEQFVPNGTRIYSTWYKDGSPCSVEEFNKKSQLVNAQYISPDGETEGVLANGTGLKMDRTIFGVLRTRERWNRGDVVLRETFYPNGFVKESSELADGLLHGCSSEFGDSGEPLCVRHWDLGELHGETCLYEGGILAISIPYQHGRKEGLERHFCPGTDEIAEEISWHEDARHGPSRVILAGHTIVDWYWNGGKVTEEQFAIRAKHAVA